MGRSDDAKVGAILRQGFGKQLTRRVLISRILVIEIVISITMVFIVSGVFILAGVPLLIMDALFYANYLKVWKSRGYSCKLLNVITFVNMVLSSILSARIVGVFISIVKLFYPNIMN